MREQVELRVRYLTILEQLWLARINLERALGAPLTPDAPVSGGSR